MVEREDLMALAVEEAGLTEQKGAGGRSLTPKQNAEFIEHSYAGLLMNPVDMKDTAAVEERVTAYLASCRAHALRPHPAGMANWFGITQQEFYDWLTDPRSNEQQKRTAARVYQMLHQAWADYALNNKVAAQVAIFLGKNWFGYTDVQRVEVNPAMQRQMDLEKLAAEAAALPDGDVIDADFVEIEAGGKKVKPKKLR